MRKKLWKLLKYALPGGIALILIWLFILSRSAALLFNRAMEQQEMLRGTITAESILADITGRVEFENLVWKGEDGETILQIPTGSLKVRPWDIVTWHLSSTTIQELTLQDALVSVRFDDRMNVDFIQQSPSLQKIDDKKPDWEKNVSLVGKSEEERRAIGEQQRQRTREKWEQDWKNFNHAGRRLHLNLELDNCLIEVFYKERHYYLSGVSFSAMIDSKKSLRLKAHTGRFGGTMIGKGMSIHGNVDFTAEPAPECNFSVLLQDVNPASLGFGMNIDDPMTLRTYFTGPLSHPIGTGEVFMERLRIPGLEFENVRGSIHYENAQIDFPNVSAKVFGGTLDAEGDYNIDTRYYHIHGHGKNLQASKALRGAQLSCPVELEMYLVSNENSRESKSYGNFVSGPGRYQWIPFDRISGRFSNAYRDLRFYDAKIDIGHYQLQTPSIRIIDGKVDFDPIDLIDMDTGELRATYPSPK